MVLLVNAKRLAVPKLGSSSRMPKQIERVAKYSQYSNRALVGTVILSDSTNSAPDDPAKASAMHALLRLQVAFVPKLDLLVATFCCSSAE